MNRNGVEIASNIMLMMNGVLSQEQMESLKDTLSDNLKYCVAVEPNKKCDTLEATYEILKTFLDFKKTYGASDDTIVAYNNCIRAFLAYCGKALLYINEETITDYLLFKKQTIAAISVNNIRRNLSSFFTWCYDFRYIPYDPLTKNLVPPIKEPVVVRHDISPQEMVMIKDAAMALPNTLGRLKAVALIDFMESTGCRVGEICNAKIEDINYAKHRVKVHGKGNKERWVYLNSTCMKHLFEYHNYRKSIGKDSIYIFSNYKADILDKPVNTHMIEDITLALGKKCGIEKLTVHIFRRYFATTSYRKGIDLESLRILMGHSKLETTIGYINVDIDEIMHAVGRVA